jgi:hypothetical protein
MIVVTLMLAILSDSIIRWKKFFDFTLLLRRVIVLDVRAGGKKNPQKCSSARIFHASCSNHNIPIQRVPGKIFHAARRTNQMSVINIASDSGVPVCGQEVLCLMAFHSLFWTPCILYTALS